MIPEPIDIKNSFLTSLNDCRALFRHCLTPRGLHTDYGVESAFLQFHKAWETFLEDSMLCFLCGQQPISGQPVTPRFIVSDFEVARTIFYQGQPYKEWTNKDDILKRYSIFFETQTIDQIETNRLITAIRPISSTIKEIIDIRNVIAHSSFAAQNKIKMLYQQKLGGSPNLRRPGEFLIMNDRHNIGNTYFDSYLSLIEVTVNNLIG